MSLIRLGLDALGNSYIGIITSLLGVSLAIFIGIYVLRHVVSS